MISDFMISLANAIAFARIIMAMALLFVEPLSKVFYGVYIACGISDVLDGYFARKSGHATWFAYIVCVVASLAAIEEVIIHLSSRSLQTEKKSIFLN